jgi:uncharacterized protein YbcI
MVGLKKSFYGKGPTKAKTFLNDNYVFCVMEGGLTRNEETLIERGHEDLVRTYRLCFQEAMTEPTVEAVQRITGCSVIGYHSQIVFTPSVPSRSSCWTGPSRTRAEPAPAAAPGAIAGDVERGRLRGRLRPALRRVELVGSNRCEHRATTCTQPASTAAGMSAYSRKNRSQTRM